MTVAYPTDTSATLTVFANEMSPDTKVSLNYYLYRNGQLVHDVMSECGGTFHIGTEVQGDEYGADLSVPTGNTPQNTFHVANYHYDYFYLAFLNARNNIITHDFTIPGCYELVFELVSEEGGSDFPIPYDNNYLHHIGGKNSEELEVLGRTIVRFNIKMETSFGQPAPSSITEKGEIVFALYPNPANDRVVLNIEEASRNSVLIVTDMNGKEVYRTTAHGNQVDFSVADWAGGIYFVTIRDESRVATKKLAVMK